MNSKRKRTNTAGSTIMSSKSRRGSTGKLNNIDMSQAAKEGRDDAIMKLKAMRNNLQNTLMSKFGDNAKPAAGETTAPPPKTKKIKNQQPQGKPQQQPPQQQQQQQQQVQLPSSTAPASSNWADEMDVEETQDDLITELHKLAEAGKEGKSVDVTQAIGLVAEAVKRNTISNNKIIELSQKVEYLEQHNDYLLQTTDYLINENQNLVARIEYLEAAHRRPEINLAKRGVIIRGIKEQEGEPEEEEDTRMKNLLLGELGLEKQMIESVKRVPLSKIAMEKAKAANKPAYRPTLVRFVSTKEKFLLFKALHKLKGKEEYREVKISNDIPLCLREWNSILEEKARALRLREKGTRTRVIFDRDSLILQARKSKDEAWRRYE